MGKIAFVFSGQGTQYTGMGRGLYENSRAAREVFKMADKLREGTSEQCFTGGAEELARTENTQPCLFCVALAAAEVLRENGVEADMLAGFSLGELAALTFSGVFSAEDGFKLVCARGGIMKKAAEVVEAGMLAVLKLPDDEVIKLCGGFKNVYPVNFNCDGQVVVSCAVDEIEAVKLCVKERGGKAMALKVGGGFHSPFMDGAAAMFSNELRGFEFGRAGLPVYSNVTALPYTGDFRELLARQMCSPVLWRLTVENMINAGADTFIETGPGKTLAGLISRISGDVRVFNVEDFESLQKTVIGVVGRC